MRLFPKRQVTLRPTRAYKSRVRRRVRLIIRQTVAEAKTRQAVVPVKTLGIKQVNGRRVLDREHCDPTKQLPVRELCLKVVDLAQILNEKQFYQYQVEFAFRIVEAVLEHGGEVLTCLMARQMGKTEVIGAIVAALLVILPVLARQFPDEWHLNITDDRGVYRGYAEGLKIGIYAPRLEQAGIMFERVKKCLETDTAKATLRELGISFAENNGNTLRLSNGSRVLCQSASEQSKIEGSTHHLLIAEEAQDISDLKMKKSLHPMVAATGGTIVKVGTATTQKCDFYSAIKHNERKLAVEGIRNHFFFPYTVGVQFNSLYRKVVEEEKLRLGEDSDEFRTSYKGEWIFERGMFVTMEQLFDIRVAATDGAFSSRHRRGFLDKAMRRYSIVAGIDWGSSSDSTVVTLMAVDWNSPLEEGETYNSQGVFYYTFYLKHVIDWLEFIGDNYEVQFEEIFAYLLAVTGLKKIVMDSNGCGKPMFDRFSAAMAKQRPDVRVEDFNFQAKLKSDGYKSLYADLCGKRITFPAGRDCRRSGQYIKFVNQMLDCRKTYQGGLMKVAHPEEKDAHDDYPDSMMLAAWGAKESSGSNTIDFLESNPFYSN